VDRIRRDERDVRVREQRGDLFSDALHAGTAGDEAVFLAAFGAGFGHGLDEPAVVALQALHQPVLDHPCRAVWAFDARTAVAA